METGEVLAEVEWPTPAFFAGLFIMIGGLIDTGVIGEVSKTWPTRSVTTNRADP
ncbi:SLC13 family permease [Streptomyces vastus]|uniref:SLC13 family permease n=1 Tax=Streptomyces vastus TaxID=285451 RepID=UPI0031D0E92D